MNLLCWSARVIGRLLPHQRFQLVGKYHLSPLVQELDLVLGAERALRKYEIAAGCVTAAVDPGQ